jgi:hypothetical protein
MQEIGNIRLSCHAINSDAELLFMCNMLCYNEIMVQPLFGKLSRFSPKLKHTCHFHLSLSERAQVKLLLTVVIVSISK